MHTGQSVETGGAANFTLRRRRRPQGVSRGYPDLGSWKPCKQGKSIETDGTANSTVGRPRRPQGVSRGLPGPRVKEVP